MLILRPRQSFRHLAFKMYLLVTDIVPISSPRQLVFLDADENVLVFRNGIPGDTVGSSCLYDY